MEADLRTVRPGMAAAVSAQANMTPDLPLDRAGPASGPELSIAGHEPATTGPNVDSRAAMSGPEIGLQARARQIYEEQSAAGRHVSGAALARQLGMSERHGRRLLAAFRAKDEGSARRNGDGAAQHEQAGPMPR